jgi:alcohol dehydrogenase class IV/choline kinase
MLKALILNSGTGSRMENLATCKCLVELTDGVTLFDTQMLAMLRCGVEDFYITTGSHSDVLEDYAKERYPGVNITFVHNPVYDTTNYIYSILLARDFVQNSNVLLLHGDIVFEQNVLQDIIASDRSVMVIDSTKSLPEKDFKAVVLDGRIVCVGVDVFTDAVYAQPMYKLLQQDWELWLKEIERFCTQGKTGVYAENAFNEISRTMNLYPLDVKGRVCLEIDNNDDLYCAQDAYRRMPDRLQSVYSGHASRRQIQKILLDMRAKKPLIVHNMDQNSAQNLFGPNAIYFKEFTSNPEHSEVLFGISLFEKENCDFIISFGGGSAIDTAKCINMLSLQDSFNLNMRDTPRARHLCIPTTAGTGSESTCFAVLYIGGEKQSVEKIQIIPDYVILDPGFLSTLPLYHKKSTVLDALCQSIESLWAKGRTPESRAFALSAIDIIYENIDGYMENKSECALRVLYAANLSGKAINLSKTTAAHAMSYKLTDLFGLAHGHAVALCLKYVWAHLLESGFVVDGLSAMEYDRFVEFFEELNVSNDFTFSGNVNNEIIDKLVTSVNVKRLGNHPIFLSDKALGDMYRGVLSEFEVFV